MASDKYLKQLEKQFENFWRWSYILLAILGIFTIFISIISIVFPSIFGQILGSSSLIAIISGIVYLILAYFIRKKNFLASSIATILTTIEFISTYFFFEKFSFIKLAIVFFLGVGTYYLWKINK